jgi:hypothetical protein
MISIKKTAVCLTLVLGLVAAPAFAGLLGTGSSYNDGLGPLGGAWEGSSSFTSSNPNLYGYVDWAVFASDAFPFTDDTPGPAPYGLFTKTAGELIYAYQVFNGGTDHLSMQIVFIDSYADNIGSVSDLSKGLLGNAPNSMSLDAPGGAAVWGFDGIVQGDNSEGLVYCSSYSPMMADAAITIDGGTYGYSMVQVPSAVPIPEPATFWMLIAAACAFAARYIRRR